MDLRYTDAELAFRDRVRQSRAPQGEHHVRYLLHVPRE